MAIALEAFTVVVRPEGLARLGGVAVFQELVPNSTFCYDDELARCAFMDRSDAIEFVQTLHLRGLETTELAEPDVVLVTAFDGTMKPDCDWLEVANYKKGWIGWLAGTEPTSIAAPSTWDPDAESNLQRMSNEEAAKRLRFVRREENVEVFVDTETGKELFVGRTGLPLDQMYEEAKDFVVENIRQPGDVPAEKSLEQDFRRVIQMLQILSERRSDSWPVHWLLGKAWHAIDDAPRAKAALQRALELDADNVDILREVAGVCLELGNGTEAVAAAEKAVAQEPENAELLSNLAVAYLMDDRCVEAKKTIDCAAKIAPEDAITQGVAQVITAVDLGQRKRPTKLADLSGPTAIASKPSVFTRIRGFALRLLGKK